MNTPTPVPVTKRQQAPAIIGNGPNPQDAAPRDPVAPTAFSANIFLRFASFDLDPDTGALHYKMQAAKLGPGTYVLAVTESTIPQADLTTVDDATTQTNNAIEDLNDLLS